MHYVLAVWQFLHSDGGVALLAALVALSEALAYIPSIKANSIFQAITNGLKDLASK